MTTWRELVYMVLDLLKIHSDDSKFTEDHVMFLLSKYRAFILKQLGTNKNNNSINRISNNNYQSYIVNLSTYTSDVSHDNNKWLYLKSDNEIPNILEISNVSIYPLNYFDGDITYISRERFKFVGYNRFLSNIIYATIGPDNFVYLKCVKELPIDSIEINAIFENPKDVVEYGSYDAMLDLTFPAEESLIPSILELVLKDLTNGLYKPSDEINNAADALSDLAGYLRRNMKSQFQKQIDE
jgi:hypothetical protein